MAARARPCAALLYAVAECRKGGRGEDSRIRSLQIDKNYRTRAARMIGFFYLWNTEAMKYEVLCPRPSHHSFVDPSGNMRKKGFIFMLAKHI